MAFDIAAGVVRAGQLGLDARAVFRMKCKKAYNEITSLAHALWMCFVFLFFCFCLCQGVESKRE
jgi:hypothetical protein